MSLGYAWLFIEPLIQLSIILLIFGVIFGRFDNGIFTIESLLFTILNWFMIRDIITFNLNALRANKNYLVYPTLKPILFYLAGFISIIITSFIVQFCFFLVSVAFLDEFIFGNAWKLIFIFVLSSIFGLSISVILASVSINKPGLKRIFALSLRFLYIGSLVIFPLDIIPIDFTGYVLLNPLAQLMELTREIIFPIRDYDISLSYIISWMLFIFILSVFIYQGFGRKID
tara:strand:- start:6015 stop:6701 length:687 start_codon:yes stop_codon:yes gene_type:complete